MLIAFTSLPGFVTMVFRGMPTVWRGRHRRIFCWLIFMPAVSPGRKTLEEMARWTPATLTAWRCGRVLKAAYWNVHLMVSWLAQDLVATLPPPTNGILYLFGDGSHADTRGTKHPVAQKGLKHLVTHVPHTYYQCTRVPREHGRKGRKTFWTYSTRLCLRHVGDVTVVLSKKGRNMGPQHTKILVTNLAELTPSQVVCIYQKRWAIELMHWELKSGLGLGEHQVSGDTNRSEKCVGIAVLAYLFVLRACHHEIVPGKPWSIFQLQHVLRLRVMTNQVEHTVKVKMAKTRKAA